MASQSQSGDGVNAVAVEEHTIGSQQIPESDIPKYDSLLQVSMKYVHTHIVAP